MLARRLAQRLAALGDLPPDLPPPPRYEGALVKAVQAFQQRHAEQRGAGRAGLPWVKELRSDPQRLWEYHKIKLAEVFRQMILHIILLIRCGFFPFLHRC